MTPDNEFDWYRRQIAEFGVAHPACVGSDAADRATAIAEKRELYSQFEIASTDSVLEMGMGNCLVTEALMANGVDPDRIFGVEVVPEFVAYARQRGFQVAEQLAGLGKYDVTLAVGILAGFDSDDSITLLKELAEHTTKRIILSFTCYPADGFRVPDIGQMTLAFGDALTLHLKNSICVGVIDMTHPNPHREEQ